MAENNQISGHFFLHTLHMSHKIQVCHKRRVVFIKKLVLLHKLKANANVMLPNAKIPPKTVLTLLKST